MPGFLVPLLVVLGLWTVVSVVVVLALSALFVGARRGERRARLAVVAGRPAAPHPRAAVGGPY